MTLSVAIGRYDRTQALFDGRVKIKGFEAEFRNPPFEELFASAFDRGEYDVAELSFSNYIHLLCKGESRYIALPIFPSRMFRHSAIFIRTDRGIRSPRDLVGRLVGVREFSMTAALVARGVLEDEYGVSAQSISWACGPADCYDSKPIVRALPSGIDIRLVNDGQNLSDMLVEGQLDGMVAYKPPKCFVEGAPHVSRLFTNHAAVEQDYFERTGIFPIMHLIGIREELASNAELCLAICGAFHRAKQEAVAALSAYQALSVMLPWAAINLCDVQAAMGSNFWPYGTEGNRRAIEAIVRYSHRQGLVSRTMEVDELFAPCAIDWVAGEVFP
jgi:4,5-dihydroxyphthalate decarboxylase